ncbi:MAG: methylthioribulose 1-phosphate dehydratase [Planctomycetaceae bacterium]|nr:methylthioribulose 1-phosphate dehydratase [Planctomycetaceae bacterium]MBP62916.1 methylthioribulose 1-phosphate dehydratase [Planctomycetaceae bacterium]
MSTSMPPRSEHGKQNDALMSLQTEVESLRELGKLFYQRGWSAGTSGNYSVVIRQQPLELLITASGKDKGRLSCRDFVRVDGEGRPTQAEQPKASAETLVHCVLARQFGVGAVLHTHSVWATILSDVFYGEGGFAIEGYEMLKGLEGTRTHETSTWIEIFENTQDISALAEQLTCKLEDGLRPPEHAFLLRRHGLYTWGPDLDTARRHVEILEFLFEVLARKLQLTSTVPAHVMG